jgi:hypothetical protein
LNHFLYIFQEISFLLKFLKIDSQGASYDPNKAIVKMSWFPDWGLDLQTPIPEVDEKAKEEAEEEVLIVMVSEGLPL